MSSNFTNHFSADDAALVLIDFQPQMFMGIESHDRNSIKNNLQIIAKSAKLFNVPTVLSTVTAETLAVRSFRKLPKERRANHRTAFRVRTAAGLGPSGNVSGRDGHHEGAHGVRHPGLLLQVGPGWA
jgi:nicotinamidase-related amidase